MPAARNQDAGLAGSTEIGCHTAPAELPGQAQGGVFLSERAIRTDGEQALAGPFPPGGNRDPRRWCTHVDETPAVALRCGSQRRHILELAVHSADDIETRLQRAEQFRKPGVANDAADIGHAHHESSGSALLGLTRRKDGQSHAHARAGTREFPDT